ncbi:MAG TPA: transmembrane 220 family protein, partial [Flavihumibacter sp.]|nr:transmembrane 220 family protein [Flavihumibacter sp.]
FVISAALQYNDPDPYIWAPIYLYGAYICYQSARGIFKPGLYIAGWLVYGGYAAYLFFDKFGVLSWINQHHAESIVRTMQADKPWIEETREFGGLLILIIALAINWVWWRLKKT